MTDAQAAMPDVDVLAIVVGVFRTLGDPTRAKILYALLSGPLCVRDLAVAVGVTESAMSHQLRFLKDRRLVKAVRRDGHQIEYRLDDHHVAALFHEAEYHADHLLRGRPDHPYEQSSHDSRRPAGRPGLG